MDLFERELYSFVIVIIAFLQLHYFSTKALKALYEDKYDERKQEVQAISGPNEFYEFYIRLKQIKDFYNNNQYKISVPLSIELAKSFTNPIEMSVLVEFSDEEGFGSYLDLNECYDLFINLKGMNRVDYLTYLMTFDHFFEIQKKYKNSEYKKYCTALFNYLRNYIVRVKPLFDLDSMFSKVEKEFNVHWDNGTFPGWIKNKESGLTCSGTYLDLSEFSCWEELTLLGLDRLKSALLAIGFKCGGTLEERAQRLFSSKSKTQLVTKSKPVPKNNSKEMAREKDIANMEAQLYCLAELVSEQRVASKENLQRKQARSSFERMDSDDEELESEQDDNATIPYNPKNFPTGWDGKPIPYWLYKLHNLNINYNCEICGNYSYKGPKAFQRHFAEWRHSHGMKCLGIPNTAHFSYVIQIGDALALWENLKLQRQVKSWNPDYEEEHEDLQGNVVNKKTYLDLKRQQLL